MPKPTKAKSAERCAKRSAAESRSGRAVPSRRQTPDNLGYLYGLNLSFDPKSIANPFVSGKPSSVELVGPADVLDRCLDLPGDRRHGPAVIRLGQRFGGRDRLADWIRRQTAVGLAVYLSKNRKLDLPISLGHGIANRSFDRLVIVAEPGSQATVVVRRQGSGLSRLLIEAELASGSEINLIVVQDLGLSDNFLRLQGVLSQDSRLTLSGCLFGGSFTSSWAEIDLDGPGALFQSRTVLAARDGERYDLSRTVNHLAKRTACHLDTAAVMLGRSKAIDRGLIRILQGQSGSRAEQRSAGLLLGSGGDFASQPQLEVDEENVRCAHGSSVGQLDRERLFYLMSRGLPRQLAARRLVEGFIEPILREMRRTGLEEMVSCLLAQRFEPDE